MAGYNWNWDNFPEYEIETAKEAVAKMDLVTLYRLDIKYDLSPEKQCCPTNSLYVHFNAYLNSL